MSTHHDREDDRDGLGGLYGPQDGQPEHLDEGEEVDLGQGHVAQVGVVGLVLLGDEEERHPLEQLHS